MSTFLTIWHYIVLISSFLTLVGSLYVIIVSADKKYKSTLILITITSLAMITYFVFNTIDKYTKKAEIRNLQKTAMLSSEKIVYSGFVKNIGDYTIGNVYITIELVNSTGGDISQISFFENRFFENFFEFGSYQPQSIEESHVVAQDLKPGGIKFFRISMTRPTYFKKTTESISLKAH
jgi:hypothetical protein